MVYVAQMSKSKRSGYRINEKKNMKGVYNDDDEIIYLMKCLLPGK